MRNAGRHSFLTLLPLLFSRLGDVEPCRGGGLGDWVETRLPVNVWGGST